VKGENYNEWRYVMYSTQVNVLQALGAKGRKNMFDWFWYKIGNLNEEQWATL